MVEHESTKVVVTVINNKDIAEEYLLRKGSGLAALKAHKSNLEFDCLKADCGICVVRVKSGMESLSEATAAESDFLKAMRAESDERLACQCRVFGHVTLKLEF